MPLLRENSGTDPEALCLQENNGPARAGAYPTGYRQLHFVNFTNPRAESKRSDNKKVVRVLMIDVVLKKQSQRKLSFIQTMQRQYSTAPIDWCLNRIRLRRSSWSRIWKTWKSWICASSPNFFIKFPSSWYSLFYSYRLLGIILTLISALHLIPRQRSYHHISKNSSINSYTLWSIYGCNCFRLHLVLDPFSLQCNLPWIYALPKI